MRLAADEGVDACIVQALRALGHDVLYVAEENSGATDDRVLLLARIEDRLLLCADKDFGELVFRLGQAHAGVVLLRLAGLTQDNKKRVVTEAFTAHEREFPRAFTVLQPGIVRIRKLVT